MRRLTRDDVLVHRLLRAARTVAAVEPSAVEGERSWAVVDFLRREGFEVMPVRRDGAAVAGLRASATLEEVPGPVDIVLAFAPGHVTPELVDAAARKGAEALWVPRGGVDRAVAARARARGLAVVGRRDIDVAFRDAAQVPGNPRKLGVYVRRRKDVYEDDRKRRSERGWVEGGGGGSIGGGGGHAVLDEKKMVAGRPSRRRGVMKARRPGGRP